MHHRTYVSSYVNRTAGLKTQSQLVSSEGDASAHLWVAETKAERSAVPSPRSCEHRVSLGGTGGGKAPHLGHVAHPPPLRELRL